MKRIALLITIVLLTAGSSFATPNPTLKDEIKQKVNMDLSKVTLDKYEEDFVLVHFKIYDGLIQIINIKASQRVLQELIISELTDIHVRTPYIESEIHNYIFTFKKV